MQHTDRLILVSISQWIPCSPFIICTFLSKGMCDHIKHQLPRELFHSTRENTRSDSPFKQWCYSTSCHDARAGRLYSTSTEDELISFRDGSAPRRGKQHHQPEAQRNDNKMSHGSMQGGSRPPQSPQRSPTWSVKLGGSSGDFQTLRVSQKNRFQK